MVIQQTDDTEFDLLGIMIYTRAAVCELALFSYYSRGYYGNDIIVLIFSVFHDLFEMYGGYILWIDSEIKIKLRFYQYDFKNGLLFYCLKSILMNNSHRMNV